MKINKGTLMDRLGRLYAAYGYRRCRLSCFDDYSLFSENMDFLACRRLITFTGRDGTLKALRPDATISVIKHLNVTGGTEKIYYNENVFRPSEEDGEFREINQTGVEFVGKIDSLSHAELCDIMLKTLGCISDEYILCVSHMAFIEGMLDWMEIDGSDRQTVTGYIKSKNTHDFAKFAKRNGISKEKTELFDAVCDGDMTCDDLGKYAENPKMRRAAEEMGALFSTMRETGKEDRIRPDFSVINSENYYDGLIFNGYVKGVPRAVLTGGRYDKLVRKMGKDGGAIGFGVYLGLLERYFEEDKTEPERISGGSDAEMLTEADRKVAEGKCVILER